MMYTCNPRVFFIKGHVRNPFFFDQLTGLLYNTGIQKTNLFMFSLPAGWKLRYLFFLAFSFQILYTFTFTF